jgi:hypothetical protein
MSNLSLPDNNQSPFDSIRRFDENGNEYWIARELMKLLGYTKWQRFGANEADLGRTSVIKKAIAACKNAGSIFQEHFTHLPSRVNGSGSLPEDWFLTRYACYLIAQNGDPEKQEIAMAQSYFATKTREAEIIIPKQNDELEMMRLRVLLAEAERDAAIAQKNLLDKREAVLSFHATTPAALILGATVITDKTPVERIIDNASGRVFEGVGITAIAKKLGFKNNKDCWQWLDSIGYGKDSNHWDLQLSAVEHHKLQPDAYDEILNKWNQGVRQRFIGE